MKAILSITKRTPLLFLAIFFFSCNSNDADVQMPKKILGGWQGQTYGSSAYDPMFTMEINNNGTWTDLTFGEAKAIEAKYQYDPATETITLFTAKGSELYKMKLEPATNSQKERLVEQTPANEYYKAMVCYRYDIN